MGSYKGASSPDERMSTVRWEPITPSDTELENWMRGIYVGGTGNLVIVDWCGVEMTFVGLAAGVAHMIPCKTVKAATTCTDVMGCW